METIETPPPPLAVAPPPAATPPPSTAPTPAPAPTPPPSAPAPTGPEDPLYATLIKDGQVILPISFLPGKPDIDESAKPVIDRVIAIMKQHADMTVTIEGHTDNTGDPDYNKTLSLDRAKAVRSQIVAGGIVRGRMYVTGLGGGDPIADDNTSEGRQQNRRIELVLRTP
jgi:outer membrane protein OmpA-like peptidoglycan-associated protein